MRVKGKKLVTFCSIILINSLRHCRGGCFFVKYVYPKNFKTPLRHWGGALRAGSRRSGQGFISGCTIFFGLKVSSAFS